MTIQKTKTNSDDDKLFKIYKKEDSIIVYDIYLSESVENPFSYSKLCNRFRQFDSGVKINLYLCSDGGQCSGGAMLINSIRECKAPILVHAETSCYSMGALLALSGTALVMKPGTFLMFHNYTAGFYGKGGELKDREINERKQLNDYNRMICHPFLTDREISLIQNDSDVYIHWDDKDFAKRLRRHFPAMKNFKLPKKEKKYVEHTSAE